MKRRDFITLLGGAAAAWPLAAKAQQAIPVIGYLSSASPDRTVERLRAFYQGLNESGYVEGRNVTIEYRWAGEQYDRFPAMAADLVRRQVAVIVATGATPSVFAAKAATTMIPIVSTMAVDPVQTGLVTSLSHPGGNLTGVANLNVELMPKRLELLHEMVPTATLLAALVNPTNRAAEVQTKQLAAAARTLGLSFQVVHASEERDIATAFATLMHIRAGGLVIAGDGFLISRSERLGALTIDHAIPAIFQEPAFAAAGGLMTYSGSLKDMYRIVGVYTGRVLHGEKPADLPIQEATKVELIINLKTAKAFGITVPITLLGRADEVIE